MFVSPRRQHSSGRPGPSPARIVSLIGALLLGACASPPAAPPLTIAATRQPASHFTLSARFSATDGKEAVSGLIDWQHQAEQEQLAFSSPLGQLLARLEADPHGAILRTASGDNYQAASPAALLPQLLGIELPLQRLPGWVQGAPAADASIRQRDPQGRPTLVIDQGWRIEYARYQHDNSDALPTTLKLSRGDSELRLVIDRWTLTP